MMNMIKKMDELKGNGKLVVVDFFATWCGPCVFISPVLADLSEQFLDVCFLKVDVDQCTQVSENCAIAAMPTFQFYKHGTKIDEVIGANTQKLKDTVAKHK